MMLLIAKVNSQLVAKVNNTDTSGIVLKTKYDADKTELEKNPDTSRLVKKSDYNAKIGELGNKIPSSSCLATTSAFTGVENKIHSVNNLVTKTDYDTKISELEKRLADYKHDKYIIPQNLKR